MNRTMRTVLMAPVVGLAMTLTLMAPMAAEAADAAHAARAKKSPNPWSAYLWPAGMSCSYEEVHGDETTQLTLRVAKRTKKMVKVRWNWGSTQVWSLAAGGRMEQSDRTKDGALKILTHEAYPTVSQVRAKRGATKLTQTYLGTYSAKEAKGFLKKGSTLKVTATYRVTGLGTKTFALQDGSVSAIGVRVKLRSIAVENVLKEHVGMVKDFYRPEMKASDSDEWWAKGRGVVQWTWDHGRVKRTQQSCS